MTSADEFMTTKEIAAILEVSYDVALLLVKTEIPHIRVGRSYRVRAYRFRQWFKQKEKLTL